MLVTPRTKTTASVPPSTHGDTNSEQEARTLHSHTEIWQWTLTKQAIAACRVQDIYDLQECDNTKPGVDPDYFWLGNVPCRSILVYGIVVGIQIYEQRVVYSVDDGSGKIDCNLRGSRQLSAPPKRSSSPVKRPTTSKSATVSAAGSSGQPSSSITLMTLPTSPKPIASVGDVVRATGRVINRNKSRLVNLDTLTICSNATDEPRHWLAVLELHETWYNAAHTTPFIIPDPPAAAIAGPSQFHSDAEKHERARSPANVEPPPEPVSPSKASVASSAPSTPSSIASNHHSSQSPFRLRHPSRLHSRDLTANTFRIYVKHYMDNAPTEMRKGAAQRQESFYESSEDEDGTWAKQEPATPTKPRNHDRLSDITPRPTRIANMDETPRRQVRSSSRSLPCATKGQNIDEVLGYSLSHLRRVPELALMAKRVVEAEAKRRAKDERKKPGDGGGDRKVKVTSKSQRQSSANRTSNALSVIKSTSVALGKSSEGEPTSAKMKRLFRYAIRQLYEDGSIVMWDGSARPHPRPLAPIPQPSFLGRPAAETYHISDASRLWRNSVSTIGDVTTSSSISSASQYGPTDDLGDVSDPPPEEESYIPLTPQYLAKIIEHAIVDIMSRPPPLTSRSHRPKAPPRPGPTVPEVVAYLHKRDERWAHVGEWAVKEALEWGREQGRLWCIGDGRWEVCG
ncbi:hypothetical protein BDW22DRAFT_1352573 [Trametopsis cervina]|nr:hypothetical protein BDW22DRAFT_1352573 [Trametopsis cervina]